MKKTIKLFLTIFICITSLTVFGQNKKHVEERQRLLAEQVNTKKQIKFKGFDDLLIIKQENNTENKLFTVDWDNNILNPYKSEPVNGEKIDVRDYVNPVRTHVVTSHYGYRPAFGRNHYGIDLKANVGDTIYTAFSGKVRITKFEKSGYGYYIVIRHPNKLETLYGHLTRFLVRKNQYVNEGDPIGIAGSTGRSTGPHLHFEFRYCGKCINPEHIVNFETHTPLSGIYVYHPETIDIMRSKYKKSANIKTANSNTNTFKKKIKKHSKRR